MMALLVQVEWMDHRALKDPLAFLDLMDLMDLQVKLVSPKAQRELMVILASLEFQVPKV